MSDLTDLVDFILLAKNNVEDRSFYTASQALYEIVNLAEILKENPKPQVNNNGETNE